MGGNLCRRRLIFPGGCPPSIVSTSELNYRVRNGNGWTLIVIGTDSIFNAFYVKSIYILHRFRAVFFGDPYGIRTHVAGVRGRSLRPLDQRATVLHHGALFGCVGAPLGSLTVHRNFTGAPSGTRTRDTLIKSQVLYQLS